MVLKNVNGKKIVVNEYGSVYCFRCNNFFRSRVWAFEHRAPNQCNLCQRKDYFKKKLKR